APKYANIDYVDFYGDKLDRAFAKFPETDLRFVLNGINGPQGGIAGMLLKPWEERTRSSIKLKPLVQAEISKIEGVQAFAFNLSQVGATLQTLLGGNYVNRFNLEGRSYQVIPQVPRDQRLSPESLGGYYVPTNTGQLVPLSTIVSIETATDPNSLTHYNQLNSATFQAVPMPGVAVGQAVDFL